MTWRRPIPIFARWIAQTKQIAERTWGNRRGSFLAPAADELPGLSSVILVRDIELTHGGVITARLVAILNRIKRLARSV